MTAPIDHSASGELQSAAVVGCGVIGAGWAARLRLRGIDVKAFDPGPQTAGVVDAVHRNAELAWNQLDLAPAKVGSLEFRDSIEEACANVDLIIESVPERLELKQSSLRSADLVAEPETIIASSTSGFRPSVLAKQLGRPERFIVAHPFNPVYLLPLVELVGGEFTASETVEQAAAWYRGLGMHPLVVRTEIDAHIADRLLEAVWREALWLVNDGVATTSEIDDAIRYGFGLRWAQMGLFETYRIAGGGGGMRHFIGQFGEALSWPWTKLTDVPELTDELVDLIAGQSDEQSGHLSIAELERLRDRNLAAILTALEAEGVGAGQTIGQLREELNGPRHVG